MHMCPTRSFFLFRGASVPCPMPFSGLVRNAHFLPYIILASSVSFVFFPMSCSGQVTDFSFLSDVMPAPCCPSSFRCHALAKKRELYPLCRHCEARKSSQRGICPCFASLSSIVIARLGKAEYLKSLRQISSLPSSLLQTDGVGGGLAFGMPLSLLSSLRGLGKPNIA